MLKANVVAFTNNMTRMASYYAAGIGSGVIAAEAYDKKNYLRDFVTRYQIPAESLRLVPSDEALRDRLLLWLGGGKPRGKDKLIARQLAWLLRVLLGEPTILHVLGEDRSALELLSDREGASGERFAVEDLFFAVYKEGTLCFLLGKSL